MNFTSYSKNNNNKNRNKKVQTPVFHNSWCLWLFGLCCVINFISVTVKKHQKTTTQKQQHPNTCVSLDFCWFLRMFHLCGVMLMFHVAGRCCMFTGCFSLPNVIKMYGAHLKASSAMIRLRLYDVLSLLPPQSFEGECRSLGFLHSQNILGVKCCVCVRGVGWGGGWGMEGGGVDVIFVADHFYLLWWLDKFFCFKLRILPLRPYDFRRTEFWKKKNYRFNLTFWDVCGLKKNKRERIFEDNCQWSSVVLKVMFPVIAVPCEACWWTCVTPRNLCRGTGGGPISVVWDGGGGREGGFGGVLYITPLCHHQNDFAFRWAVVWTLVKYHRIIMRGRKSQESWSGLETKFICSTARHLTARWNHLTLSDMWPLIIFISVFFKVLVSVWH